MFSSGTLNLVNEANRPAPPIRSDKIVIMVLSTKWHLPSHSPIFSIQEPDSYSNLTTTASYFQLERKKRQRKKEAFSRGGLAQALGSAVILSTLILPAFFSASARSYSICI